VAIWTLRLFDAGYRVALKADSGVSVCPHLSLPDGQSCLVFG